jgi:hypothetical protein
METGNPAGVPFFIISRGGYMGVIRREDFIFALGYEGDVAVVDGRSRGKYRRYTAVKLAEEGLFKPAVCAAVYDEDKDALEKVLEIYNHKAASPVPSVDELKRTLGVTEVPPGITKVNIY